MRQLHCRVASSAARASPWAITSAAPKSSAPSVARMVGSLIAPSPSWRWGDRDHAARYGGGIRDVVADDVGGLVERTGKGARRDHGGGAVERRPDDGPRRED